MTVTLPDGSPVIPGDAQFQTSKGEKPLPADEKTSRSASSIGSGKGRRTIAKKNVGRSGRVASGQKETLVKEVIASAKKPSALPHQAPLMRTQKTLTRKGHTPPPTAPEKVKFMAREESSPTPQNPEYPLLRPHRKLPPRMKPQSDESTQPSTSRSASSSQHREPDAELVTSLAREISDTERVAKDILTYIGHLETWVSENPSLKTAPLPQLHRIKAIKTYLNEAGELELDIAKGVIGIGAVKKAKEIVRVANGRIQLLVRLTAQAKEDTRGQALFTSDMKKEFSRRDEMGTLPGILPVTTRTYQPLDRKTGRPKEIGGIPVTKTRFFMEKCDGTLQEVVERTLVRTPGRISRSVHYIRGAVDGLKSAHSKNIVHMDLKPGNILRKGEDGFLSDFGFSQKEGTEIVGFVGTRGYVSPEIMESHVFNSPVIVSKKMDMWGVGALLLEVVDPGLARDIQDLQKKMKASHDQEERERLLDDFFDKVEEAQENVKNRGPYGKLVSELLDLDPEKRPTVEECSERLSGFSQRVESWYPSARKR